jgi:hypothetical protein
MAYATLDQFRSVTNFTISEISDAEVTALIADADRNVVRLTTTEVYLERLWGNVDGTNVDFKTRFAPIADKNADGSVDGDDITVYYATFDSVTNWRELGSAQTVTSIQDKEGIITMDTAPTNVTAAAGVFAIYRFDSRGQTSIDIYKLAACQYLGYLVAEKLKGKTPNYNTTEISVREDVTKTDWLGLCYETLELQDKLYLNAPRGFGIPRMNVDGSTQDQYCDAKRGSWCGNGYRYGGYY